MTLIILNNKSVVIESATYAGKVYKDDELSALVDQLNSHLINISGDIDLSNHTFTVYRDHVESNGKSVKNHPTDYQQIVEKTQTFVYDSPKSPLSQNGSQPGIDPELLKQKLEPLAVKQKESELDSLEKENQQLKSAISNSQLEIEKLEQLLETSKKDAATYQAEAQTLQSHLSKLQGELAVTAQNLAKANEQLAERSTEQLIPLMGQLQIDHIELARLSQENQQLKDVTHESYFLLEEAEKKLNASNSGAAYYEAEIDALKSEIRRLQEKQTGEGRSLFNQLEDRLYETDKALSNARLQLSKSQSENTFLARENADLKDELNFAKSNEDINYWKSALQTQADTIAQLNTKLGTFKHDVEQLEDAARVKTREYEQVLRNLRLREKELSALRAQSAEMKAEISSIIAELKAEIEGLRVKPKDEKIIKAVDSPAKSTNSIAEKIQKVNNKNSLKLNASENVRLETNMLFLEHPIKKIIDGVVTLDNETEIKSRSKNSSENKIATEIISINKKFKRNVANLRNLTNIDGFVESLLKKKNVNAKDLLVQNGSIVPKLMAYEFLSRNQESKEYNKSLNDIRKALIDLKNRTVIEVVS